jgi:hypothetical protein
LLDRLLDPAGFPRRASCRLRSRVNAAGHRVVDA